MLFACSSKTNCLKCNGRHNTLLHRSPLNVHNESLQSASCHASIAPLHSKVNNVLLSTAVVHVMNSFGIYQPVRIFIDSGAQTSFTTSSCVQNIGLKVQNCSLL